MQSGSLNDFLFGKYILCVCEGIAEESIIDLLLDNNKLCFKQDIEIKNQAETENQNYLLLEQFLNLSNNLVNIPNLNELTQKYTENNPDKFANEIEHLYSIIDTISPKQFK